MVKLLLAVIPAVFVVAIAILSVQNAEDRSITFFSLESTKLPIGVWLALALGTGMAGTALLLSLFSGKKVKGDRR